MAIRTSLVLTIALANLIGGTVIFMLSLHSHVGGFYIRDLTEINVNTNLRGTKIKLMEMKKEIQNQLSAKNQKYNQSYFTEEKFVFQNKNEKDSAPKSLRKLDSYDIDHSLVILIMQCASFIFTIILLCTTCLTEDECCTRGGICCDCCVICCCEEESNCCKNALSGDCKSDNCNIDGEGAIGLCVILLAIAVIVGIFVGLYYALNACGKHLARYFFLSFISIIYIYIFICGCLNYKLYSNIGLGMHYMLIIGISGLLFLANFLGLLLPCFKRCEFLTYEYTESIINEPMDKNLLKSPIVPVGSDFVAIPKSTTNCSNETKVNKEQKTPITAGSSDFAGYQEASSPTPFE